jgi:hypothetical protein
MGISSLSKQEEFSPEFFNQQILKMRQLTGCDTECQKRRHADKLRNKWKRAERNEREAPMIAAEAEKKYYEFSKGDNDYKQMLMQRYTQRAEERKVDILKKHQILMNQIDTMFDDYTAQIIALDRINELLRIRTQEHNELKYTVGGDIAGVQTNERRVVYQVWAQDWLSTVKKILTWCYILIIVVYLVLGSFIINKKYLKATGWIPLVIMIVTPFTISYVASILEYLWNTIRKLWDNRKIKNVYL